MKVYVITQGCYSDYHICAVTLDKDKAEQLRKMYTAKESRYGYSSSDVAEIEEYETDDTGNTFTEEEKQSNPVEYYHIEINYNIKKNGITSSKIENLTACFFKDNEIVFDEVMAKGRYYGKPYLIDYEVNVRADRSKDEAKKIAYDRFYKMLAERYGL